MTDSPRSLENRFGLRPTYSYYRESIEVSTLRKNGFTRKGGSRNGSHKDKSYLSLSLRKISQV